MSKNRKEIFSNNYMSLFSDGTLGLSDGVGYVDTLSEEETFDLFEAMRLYFTLQKSKVKKQILE